MEETFEQFFKRQTGILAEDVPAHIVRNWRKYWRSLKEEEAEAGLQYAEVLEKARKWDEVEPYLPKMVGHLLIEWLKKVSEDMFFKDEDTEAEGHGS